MAGLFAPTPSEVQGWAPDYYSGVHYHGEPEEDEEAALSMAVPGAKRWLLDQDDGAHGWETFLIERVDAGAHVSVWIGALADGSVVLLRLSNRRVVTTAPVPGVVYEIFAEEEFHEAFLRRIADDVGRLRTAHGLEAGTTVVSTMMTTFSPPIATPAAEIPRPWRTGWQPSKLLPSRNH